jgi:hypothetical protein
MRPVLDAVAQYVDDTPLASLTLEPGQEFLPCGTITIKVEGLN